MSNKKERILENIKTEIEKIDKKENRLYFFVIDTKGAPSGSLEYIYNLALILKDEGYNVSMLHTEDEFVGVESWLGKEYSELPHFNVNKGDIGYSFYSRNLLSSYEPNKELALQKGCYFAKL